MCTLVGHGECKVIEIRETYLAMINLFNYFNECALSMMTSTFKSVLFNCKQSWISWEIFK